MSVMQQVLLCWLFSAAIKLIGVVQAVRDKKASEMVPRRTRSSQFVVGGGLLVDKCRYVNGTQGEEGQ